MAKISSHFSMIARIFINFCLSHKAPFLTKAFISHKKMYNRKVEFNKKIKHISLNAQSMT